MRRERRRMGLFACMVWTAWYAGAAEDAGRVIPRWLGVPGAAECVPERLQDFSESMVRRVEVHVSSIDIDM